MPLVDSNLQETWDSLYNVYDIDPVTGQIRGMVGYQRTSSLAPRPGDDGDRLYQTLQAQGLLTSERLAIIGGGFGWKAERFIALGFPQTNLCVVDTSTWIQSNKTGNAALTINNSDVNNATGRRAIKQTFGSPNTVIHWTLSEDVLPILTDNECIAFASACRSLSNRVVHYVSTLQLGANQDSRLNWKTLETWKAFLPLDLFIEAGTMRAL